MSVESPNDECVAETAACAGKFSALALLALLAFVMVSSTNGSNADEESKPQGSPKQELQKAQRAELVDAVELRDVAAIASLLDAKADVNQTQIDGMSALHWAAFYGDLKLAQRLIQAGADANVKNRYGVTPLSIACTNGSEPVVQLLLNAGANANSTLPGGETALMTAARTGKVGPVKALLEHGAKVDATERKRQTAIMWAAAEGHAPIVDLLIKAQADFRKPLRSGFTPLFFAVREGRRDVLQVLLKAGADANAKMEPEKKSGKKPRSGTTPLILAVENGHFDLAVDLLEAGADPNDQGSGFTALHTLTWVRKPNRGDGADGDPAPIGSGKLNSLQFVEKLVEHGADVDARLKKTHGGRGHLHRQGATAFLLAAKSADIPLLKLLVKLGCDPMLSTRDGCTPLMAAAGMGTQAPGEEAGTETEALAALEYLLDLGADVNAVSRRGETAMHGAAYKSLPRVVHFLAKHGAHIKIWNKKNRSGWTPLLIAEGHRPGNFKPSFETIQAIHEVMIANGLTPPEPTPRKKRAGYQ